MLGGLLAAPVSPDDQHEIVSYLSSLKSQNFIQLPEFDLINRKNINLKIPK